MQWKQMLLISNLKNEHFKCISLMNGYFSLDERSIVENYLITIISKPNYLKSLGLKRKALGKLKRRDKKGFKMSKHVIGNFQYLAIFLLLNLYNSFFF